MSNNAVGASRSKVMATPRAGVSPLKCPRCRSHLAWVDRTSFEDNICQVRCAGCEYSGPRVKGSDHAVVAWNKIPR